MRFTEFMPLRVSLKHKEKLTRLAEAKGVSRAQIIRNMIDRAREPKQTSTGSKDENPVEAT